MGRRRFASVVQRRLIRWLARRAVVVGRLVRRLAQRAVLVVGFVAQSVLELVVVWLIALERRRRSASLVSFSGVVCTLSPA